jgi:hypothetical protein
MANYTGIICTLLLSVRLHFRHLFFDFQVALLSPMANMVWTPTAMALELAIIIWHLINRIRWRWDEV